MSILKLTFSNAFKNISLQSRALVQKTKFLHSVKVESLSNFLVENSDSNTTEFLPESVWSLQNVCQIITKVVNLISRFIADRNFCGSEIDILEKFKM